MVRQIPLLFIALFFACKSGPASHPNGDRELARVYNKSLWLSQMEGMFPAGMSKADSSATIAAFVQNWSRAELMAYEAERNMPQDLNIDDLVRDYRASLVRHKYEEQIFGEKLDTSVTDRECRAFYEANPDLFLLQNTVLRALVLKVKTPVAASSDLQKAWSASTSAATNELKEYAARYAESALLDEKKWYNLDEIAAILPKNALSGGSSGRRELTTKDEGYQFYVRVLEAVGSNETAPFDQARERIEAMILHKRKIDLLQKWQNDLYQTELRRENVKVF